MKILKLDTKSYNLTFKRVVLRIFLTGTISILFIVAMFPFMQVADGLLYEQRAAVGSQNILRVVILWGIYTLILTFVTFWKKWFRMVAVFLILLWIAGTSFVLLMNAIDSSSLRCRRTTPYPAPPEVNRAMDLIAQRLNIESNYNSYQGNAFNYRNCLNIQYFDSKEIKGYEGFFLEGDPNLQNLKIMLNPQYKSFDDLSIATILMHELTHAGQYIYEINSKNKQDCFVKEAEAFTAQSVFTNQLNAEERRSIFARITENINLNPAFQILANVDQRTSEAYDSCQRLRKENNLNDTQFNECVWTGTKNKLEADVRQDEYYQEQCNENK